MQYEANPDYGTGRFRRAIQLEQPTSGRVLAQLEDDAHGFTIELRHDGERVTGIDGGTERIPLNTCADAPGQLAALVGFALSGSTQAWIRRGNPSSQCTHLFDLATLAFHHAGRGAATRRYDIVVEDAGPDEVLELRAFQDGVLVFDWRMDDQQRLLSPDELAGMPMMRGFHQWASARFDGDELELATQLQRGSFVAFARRYNHDAVAGQPAAEDGMRLGTCYSYSEPVVHDSFRLHDTVRDFSDCPEELLKFR